MCGSWLIFFFQRPQQRRRAPLVPPRPHARGAAVLAGAVFHGAISVGEEFRRLLREALGEAGAAGVLVVDVEGADAEVGVADALREAEVPRVAEEVDRSDEADEGARAAQHEARGGFVHVRESLAAPRVLVEKQDERAGLHLLLREVDVPVADVLVGVEAYLLELRDLRPHEHVAEYAFCCRNVPRVVGEKLVLGEYLEEDGIVRHTGAKWHWADRSYPAEGVSLRSAGADNVVIIDVTKGRNAVIGEMDRPSAKELIFENAVYMHRGRQYLVEKLDIENRKCLVVEADVNYFTDGLTKTDIKVLSEDEVFTYEGGADGVPAARGVLGDVLVRSQVAKFKKIRFHTHENIGYGDINLPEEEMQTRSLVLLFGKDTLGGKALAGMDEAAAGLVLGGAGTLIRLIAPIYLLCDPRDLGLAERVRDPHFGVSALYIYDKYPGGTGLAESLAGKAPELFAHACLAVERCPCKDGCPSCVGPGGNKRGTRELLRALTKKE